MKTHRTAVFTGAGASKAFDYPLTGDLFPAIREDLKKGVAFEGIPPKSKNEELMRFLCGMLPGFLTAERLPYITDVLSLIDHSLLVGNTVMVGANPQDLLRFRVLLEEAIFHALWKPHKALAQGEASKPQERLGRIVRWLLQEGQADNREIALISTNYDIAIENLLFRAYDTKYGEIPGKFDFGMNWRTPLDTHVLRPRNPELRVYKLHGSLNWLRCDLCQYVYVNLKGSIAHLAFREEFNDANMCDCGHRLRAALVAPSLVRDIRDVNLLEIWKAAFEYLRRADQWVVIGYSFPPEDIAIHSLFLRAYQGRPTTKNREKRPPPTIRVIQDKEDAAVSARYKLFFPDCTFEYGGTEAFIDALPT